MMEVSRWKNEGRSRKQKVKESDSCRESQCHRVLPTFSTRYPSASQTANELFLRKTFFQKPTTHSVPHARDEAQLGFDSALAFIPQDTIRTSKILQIRAGSIGKRPLLLSMIFLVTIKEHCADSKAILMSG